MMKKGGVISVLLLVGLGCIFLHATDQASDCSSPNSQHITTKALLAKAIKRVQPSIPSGFGRIDSKVYVKVIVDPKGTVTCASAAEKAHPILRKLCEEAARQWLFKPFLKKGRPVTVNGVIIFHVMH
jgi:hypothetical protein